MKKIKPKITNYECFKSVTHDDKNIPKTDFKTKDDLEEFKKDCETLKKNFCELRKGTDSCSLYDIKFQELECLKKKENSDFFLNFTELAIGTADKLQAEKILVALMDFFKSLLTVERQNEKKSNKQDEEKDRFEVEKDDSINFNYITRNENLKEGKDKYILIETTNEGTIGVVFRKEKGKIYAIMCNHSAKSKAINKIKEELNRCKNIHNIINLAKIQNDNEHCSVLSSIFFDEMYDFFKKNNKNISDIIDENNKSNKSNINLQEEDKNIFDENNNSNTGEIISPNNIKNENNKQIDISDETTKSLFPNLYKYRQKDVNKAEDIDKKYKGFLLQTDTYNILTDEEGNHKVYNLGLFRAGWERAIGCLIENLDDTPLFVLQTFIDAFEKQCKLFDEVIKKQLNYQHKEEELNNICTNEDYFNKKEIKEKIKQIEEEIKIRDQLKKDKKNSEQKVCDKIFDFYLLCLVVTKWTKYITQYQYDYIEKYKEYFGEIFYDIAKNKRPKNDTKIKDIMAGMGKNENDLGEELQKIEKTIKRKEPFTDNVVFGKKNKLNDKKRFFKTRDEMIEEFASSGLTKEANENLEKIKRRRLKNKNFNN